ncbi:MAG TPA: YicC family protein [candidate division Zixibacteria bacterium]|nr:YicC family protein [candidate division Zixibacteria bacterium]
MIYSMTGYGRAECEKNGRRILIEINSLNNRYCEVMIRLPKSISHLESCLKEIVLERVRRGKVIIVVNIEESAESLAARLELNKDVAIMYHKIFSNLKEELELPGDIDINQFVGLPDLIKPSEEEMDEEKLKDEIISCLRPALDDFIKMRAAEGKRLMEDITKHIDRIERSMLEAEASSRANIQLYNEKLKSRLRELLAEVPVSDEMVANEAAMIADKSDITEECVRIKSHLEMFRNAYESDEPIGKKMNFILQELYREANTIGSKSISPEISRNVIMMKEEIEKVREQVQNLE